MHLSIYPTELGFQELFISIQFESIVKQNANNDNKILVSMDVIACTLRISKIINNSIPYFGKFTLNKLFHTTK